MKFKEKENQVSPLTTKSNVTKRAETLGQARVEPNFVFSAEGISVTILSHRNVPMARGEKA